MRRRYNFTNNRRTDNRGNSLEEEKKPERVCKLLRPKEVSQHQGGQKNIGRTDWEWDNRKRLLMEIIPRHPVGVHVEELTIVGVTQPASVLCNVLRHVYRDHQPLRPGAVHPGQGRRHGLDEVAQAHGQAAEHQARVVEEQTVDRLWQGPQYQPGHGVADADEADQVTTLGGGQAEDNGVILFSKKWYETRSETFLWQYSL